MIRASDLILRFDADSGKVLLLVPRSPNEVSTLKRFFEFPVSAKVTVSEFAEEVGISVAAFMHARHPDRFRVEEKEVEEAVSSDSEKVTFGDARLLIGRLGDSSTISDLDAVTALLEHASKHGDQEATRYLLDLWPGLRAVFLRRLSRDA